jgi:hypothetical protein
MQQSQHRSHCWKNCLKSSTECCQGPSVILIERLQRQQNASLSNPDSSLGTKRSSKEQGSVSRGVGHNHHFIFSQKGGDLLMLQRFSKNCWQLLTAFPMKILDDVSSNRSGAGIAASSHPTLKGTKVSDLYEYIKYIFFIILGIPPPLIWGV